MLGVGGDSSPPSWLAHQFRALGAFANWRPCSLIPRCVSLCFDVSMRVADGIASREGLNCDSSNGHSSPASAGHAACDEFVTAHYRH